MFTEVLKIKPQLDNSDVTKMERTLSRRFGRVAKTFGKGIQTAVKGSILGIGLSLLNRLMNPIAELEERIKNLLDMGKDVDERAAQLGATPGELLRLEAAAEREGISPDQLQSVLSSYQSAIETARREILAGGELSPASQSLREFAMDENAVESFQRFLSGLRIASPEARAAAERDVLGGTQRGAMRRLIENGLDFSGAASAEDLSEAVSRAAALSRQQRLQERLNQQSQLMQGAGVVSPDIVSAMTARAQATEEAGIRRLADYQTLAKASEDLAVIRQGFEKAQNGLTQALGYLGQFARWATTGGPERLMDDLWRKMPPWIRNLAGRR